MSKNYSQQFRKDLEEGQQFQDYIATKLWEIGIPFIQFNSIKYQKHVGESMNGIEVKYDKRMKETGNIYIETAARPHQSAENLLPSGINRPSDNSWLWVVGDYRKAYIIPKKYLLEWAKKAEQDHEKYQDGRLKQSPQLRLTQTRYSGIVMSEGFLLPVAMAEKYCAKTIERDLDDILGIEYLEGEE
jgi:hypothetical protein